MQVLQLQWRPGPGKACGVRLQAKRKQRERGSVFLLCVPLFVSRKSNYSQLTAFSLILPAANTVTTVLTRCQNDGGAAIVNVLVKQ